MFIRMAGGTPSATGATPAPSVPTRPGSAGAASRRRISTYGSMARQEAPPQSRSGEFPPGRPPETHSRIAELFPPMARYRVARRSSRSVGYEPPRILEVSRLDGAVSFRAHHRDDLPAGRWHARGGDV